MVKKLLALAFFAFIPLTTLYAYDPTDNTRANPDWMTATRMKNGTSTVTFRIDHFGNIRPGEDGTNIIGSTEAAYRRVYATSLDISSGLVNVHQIWVDVALSSVSNFNPLGFAVTTTTLFTGATTFRSQTPNDLTLPGTFYARPLTVVATFTVTDMGITTTAINGGCTCYGITNLGIFEQERIALSTNQTPSNNTWAYISSITCHISSGVNMTAGQDPVLMFGTSDYLGLSNVITSTGDVYMIIEAGTGNLNDAAVTINTEFSKIRFEAAYSTNSREFQVWYKTRRSPYR